MIELPCSTNSKMMLAPAADKLGLIWNTQEPVLSILFWNYHLIFQLRVK